VQQFFSADDQLMTFGEKTYAVSSQWSKDTLEAAMATLLARYGSLGFSYAPSEPTSRG
jgi:hypothetical protein